MKERKIMSRLTDLKVLAKGYMAQKKEIKEKDEELRSLQTTKDLVTDLSVQGTALGTDIQLFIARAQDKMRILNDSLASSEAEKSALQRSMARISVDLSNAQSANANLVEENTKLRELVAKSRGDMYEMLHNESKDNLKELADLRSENVSLKADTATMQRELADAKKIAEQVPALQAELDKLHKELDDTKAENRRIAKELKVFQAQKTTSVADDGDILLG